MREMKESGVQWIGTIPAHWNMVPTKRLFQVVSGATPQADQEENWDGDIVWVTPADFKTDDRDVSKGKRTLTQQGFDSCSTTLVPAGSLIFSKRAPIGAVVMNTVDLCTNQGCLSSIPYSTEATCVRYFYYVMAIATEQYELLGSGTTFKEISATNFANFVLPAPDYEEQQQIVTHLDTKCAQIDALIANVQAQMEQLKQYKQSLITEVVTKGLDPDVPMKDSGVEWIGEIPASWKNVTLKRYIDILSGYAFSSDDFKVESGIRLLRGINVTPDGIDWTSTVLWDKPIDEKMQVYVLQAGDLVVGLDRPWISSGTRASFISFADLPCLLLQRVCRIRTDNVNLYSKWVYYWIVSNMFYTALSTETTGISVPHISSEQIANFCIAVPTIEEQEQLILHLDAKCAQIDRLLAIKQAKIDKLTEYKKSLIYEYVTGKREVV